MAIKDISVVIDLSGERTAVRAAADLARRLGAHLTGLALAYDPVVPGYAVAPVPADFMISARDQALDEANTAVAAFQTAVADIAVRADTAIVDVMAGGGLDGLVHAVRLADLVIVSEDDPDRPEPVREALIEAVLFNVGAPLLLLPRAGVASIDFSRIVIAWDGTVTAARAVRAASSFLKLATEVDIVMVDDGKNQATGERLAAYLARHDVDAQIKFVRSSDKNVSAAIRQAAIDVQAGVIVMGAYGHSRLLEWIFGGATRGMLDGLSLPVLMAH